MATSEKPSARPREASSTLTVTPRRQVSESLPLAFADPQPAGPVLQPVLPLKTLWLAVYLPALPLEALSVTPEPVAVIEEQRGVRRLLLMNRQAEAEGVQPGMLVNAALALSPGLELVERDPLKEARVLKELAAWAEKFTSLVCIESPAFLLLEIAGSLTLFGGLRPLRQRIVQGLESQGFSNRVAIAPTPLAATWLARCGQKVCVRDPQNLVGKLGSLPLSCLDWPVGVTDLLKGMGVTRIGEALRLPRAGFAKRFGATRLLEFDRALGRLPDPRMAYRAPERFIADFDLNEEQSDAGLILNACRELLVGLERFLRGRQAAVQAIEISFFHLREPATHLSLGCVQADRAVVHWFDLLELRFEKLSLAAPVIAVRLCAGEARAFETGNAVLPFSRDDRATGSVPIAHLAERLSARMGELSVHGVMTVAEHRPQYAWKTNERYDEVPRCDHGVQSTLYSQSAESLAEVRRVKLHSQDAELLAEIQRTNSLVLRRPLWVLDEPCLLELEGRHPCYDGPLKLVSGPERLESGWWDGKGIARDYFVAVNPTGVHLWIYRNRHGGQAWYLHGKFG